MFLNKALAFDAVWHKTGYVSRSDSNYVLKNDLPAFENGFTALENDFTAA